jgi:hypothetical protein
MMTNLLSLIVVCFFVFSFSLRRGAASGQVGQGTFYFLSASRAGILGEQEQHRAQHASSSIEL